MNTTLELTKASIRMFVRNKQAFFFTLLFPLIIMVIFGLIGFDRQPKIPLGLVTGNPQESTKQFINQIKNFPTFEITEGKLDDLMVKLKEEDDLAAILVVPDDVLTPDFNKPKELKIYINESQQNAAQAAVSILNQFLDKTNLTIVHAPTLFALKPETINSRNLKYIDFLLPGLVAMSVMQMAVFSVAFVIVQYKEKGVLKRLVATPMLPREFLTANVVTRLIVSVIQTVFFIVVGVLILKAHIVGSYWLILLCVILGVLMFLGLGFTASGLAKTVETVPVFANLVVFPMLFLGGVFFPIQSMPNWLQKVANFLPLTHFSTSLREIMTKDAGLGDIKWNLLAMLAWAVVLIMLATFTFRFQEKE